MDEYYEMLLDELGPQDTKLIPSGKEVDLFRGRLPDKLLEYWVTYGWGSYYNGLFWLTNPADYSLVVDAWLSHTKIKNRQDYFVIARSAFGKLFLWSKATGQNVTISPHSSLILTSPPDEEVKAGDDTEPLQFFISEVDSSNLDLLDYKKKGLFDRALKKLGSVGPDEMYGFEPALSIGGIAKIDHLVKVKAVPHLVLLEQLSDVEVRHIDVGDM